MDSVSSTYPVRKSTRLSIRNNLATNWNKMFNSVGLILRQLENPRFYAKILLDTAAFVTALILANCLRFEFTLTHTRLDHIWTVLPILVTGKLVVFGCAKLYKGMWRYSGLYDYWRLAQACLVSMLFCIAIVLYSTTFKGYSRSVFLLDGVLTFLLAGGVRLAIRCYYAALAGSQEIHGRSSHSGIEQRAPKRTVIVGAGGSGEKMLRDILDNPHLHYEVIGFLDDDPAKLGREIHGVPVLGCVEALLRETHERKIQQVFISTPSATGSQMRRIVDICKSCDVPYKTLPAIGQILDGNVSIKSLRDVNSEDLLRRQPVALDTAGIKDYITDRNVLVTGAGGSIGSELCRQLIRFRPGKLILVDAGEANLYGIQVQLRHELKFSALHTILARAQERPIMEDVFKRYRPDVVFHAAAYKHVPMLEQNPWEAIFNNVLGTRVVMEAAAQYGAKRFVLVSTDKAVRPTNVMGTSKRLAELILLSMQGGPTRFIAVRFGNVLASSGSVVPLFRKQIERGGPVTVTHPDISRYFMTIPESCQLILQAGAIGKGGEIFVLEMGTPVKIADLATDLIRLSGKMPGRDVQIVYTGLRPGEKLHEELITVGEDVIHTSHEKIMTLKYNGRWSWNGLNSQEIYCNWLNHELEELYEVAKTHDACAIKEKLRQVVPEYTPQDTESVL